MGLTDKIGIAILCAFVLFSVVRLFAAPLRLAAKVLLNTALGFLALFLLGLTEPVTGFSLGLNFFNALTVGILGVPGLVLLVLLSPVFLVLAIAIKLDSCGPVFYRQVRVTQYGREFRIFKFRTMVQNADRIGSQVTVSGDSRITRVGKVIRSGDGSALMRDHELAGRVIEAVVKAVDVPVTVKFRKGWDGGNVNAVAFAQMCQQVKGIYPFLQAISHFLERIGNRPLQIKKAVVPL